MCRQIRAEGATPVILLTARDREADKINGLGLGADDYVTKPFSLRELTARVKAVLRRAAAPEERQAAAYRGTHLIADFDAVAVAVDGEPINLTRREFELLRYLVKKAGQPVSRRAILEEVWDLHESTDTRAIDNFIVRLRRYLEDRPASPKFLLTVRGVGYRFVPDAT